jgi:hypothetical protein
MNNLMNIRYKEIIFDIEQLNILKELLDDDLKSKAALYEIAKKTRTKNKKDLKGISKAELTKTVSELNRCRANTERVIAKLIGMTIIYYEEDGNAKMYQVNNRGVLLLKRLQQNHVNLVSYEMN